MGKPVINKGLEGIYMTESRICKVDGKAGKLYYRGYPIEALARHSSFEETCYLILYGRLPTRKEFDRFDMLLKKERALPQGILDIIEETVGRADVMDILRTAVSALPAYDPDAYNKSKASEVRESVALISKLGSIVATIGRVSQGEPIVKPDLSLSHAGNFLYMLNGRRQGTEEARLLDTMLILHAEHSSNASTFSALVTGSTLSDLYAAVTSGIGTLKGPLHGGADSAALKMMNAIGRPENTERYINRALAGKQRIMGFGHRVYKTYDPRARIIKKDLESLQKHASKEVRRLTAIALRAEKMMVEKLGKTHNIWPNVDFFSGPVYTAIGIPEDLFTPLFAVSRVPGWCAHMIEYWEDNRLIRPLEYYTGKVDREYVPMGKRG